MNGLPLHPAIVHLPLGLALLMPLLAAGFAWAVAAGRVRPRTWLVVVAAQALLVGAGYVAMNTGAEEEERVETVVRESAIEAHEERAEQFMWAAGATLVLTGVVVAVPVAAIATPLAVAATMATVAVAGMGLRVGHAGGQLVYQYGAASAYATPARAGDATGVPAARGPAAAGDRHDDDDDDR